MKFHDRSRTMRPDLFVLVPVAVLFISSLNGPSVAEALKRSVHTFFSPYPGLVLWAQACLLELALYLYFAPVFRAHIGCMRHCDPDKVHLDRAMRRLNGLQGFTIAASVTVFVLGRLVLLLGDAGLEFSGLLDPRRLLFLAEAAANGLFVSAILSLQFEDRLFMARETVLRLGPSVRPAYSSLYAKVFMVLMAIVLFMTLQAFTVAGSFYSIEAPQGLPGLRRSGLPLTGPELLFFARRQSGLLDAIYLFLFRMLLVSFLAGQMLWQIKRIIKRPIATVLDRLTVLNAPGGGAARSIAVVQNDEFAAVYREINTLIDRQRGELETSRRRLEAVVTCAPDPILAFDAEGKVRLFNPAAEKLFGYAPGAAIGLGLEALVGDRAAAFLESHRDSGGLARRFWRAADGTGILMESHLSSSGDGEWTVAILRDMRRQAEAEEALRAARAEAENASRMKSEFLANMSHELRTPLNAILGFTQLLAADRNLTGAQQERVRVVSRSGEHLLALINDILDISKIEAGKMELHEGVFDLPEFVADLRDLFELKCRKKGLSLYVDTLEGLPRYVRGDLGKLRQVMINLLGNAVKFTAEGGIAILVGRSEDGPAGGASGAAGGAGSVRIRFSVSDTGRGIPTDEREAILQPFVQASTTDHEGGTGLGLAISSRYVAMMGGRLSVESSVGKGSTFSFELPLLPTEDAPASEADEGLEVRVAADKEVTVLVVDDQEANRLVLKEMLERAGFSVLEARDGREAVAAVREFMPAVVFMDIKMPVMDGYAAAEALKRDPATKAVKVFALTASAFSHDEERIAKAGFDGFLAKPFKIGALFRLVRERGGLEPELEARAAAPAGAGARPEAGPADWAAARAALGPAALAALADAALINDFASLARAAEALEGAAPAAAAALRSAAGSYDETAIGDIIKRLGAEGEGA